MARRKPDEEPEDDDTLPAEDPELDAITDCVAALEPLEEDQQAHVLAYLQKRFGGVSSVFSLKPRLAASRAGRVI